jgi:murein DD-endopeptidase MepM/ murein hydrolase activator NlpD
VAFGTCTGCGAAIPLHAARPRVTADGRVSLECDPCARGEVPVVVAIEPDVSEPVPAVPRRAWLGGAATVAAVGLISVLGASAGGPAGSASAAAAGRPEGWDQIAPDEPDEIGEEVEPSIIDLEVIARPAAALDGPPPEPPEIPTRNGESLDEWFPTLQIWVHPVPDSPDIIPTRATRIFGAPRSGGGIRTECGAGHCGVDLEGVRGQDVVAVAWGTVVKIQRDPNGRGGRYVKLEHPDFVYTSYFHLDEIDKNIEIGMEVEPGTPLGSLGASGIHISMPHLHFALEIVDKGQLRFIDPVPFLFRAEVLPRQ